MTGTQRTSAGLLLFRRPAAGEVEVLIGHMGGPFWARKEDGAWSVPKGEPAPGEDLLETALREFTEELGVGAPQVHDGVLLDLGSVRQSGGKTVVVWAVEGDLDPDDVVPGTFEMEWPPRSGRTQRFPELDRVAWFPASAARRKVVRAQAAFLDRLADRLGVASAGG